MQFSHFDDKYENLKMSPTHFCSSFYRFIDINIFNCLPPKLGQGSDVQFSQSHSSMANGKSTNNIFYIIDFR